MPNIEPGMELFLIWADGEWPIAVAETPGTAISSAEHRKRESPGRQVRVDRIIVGKVEHLEVQEQITRKRLVPKGTAVDPEEMP